MKTDLISYALVDVFVFGVLLSFAACGAPSRPISESATGRVAGGEAPNDLAKASVGLSTNLEAAKEVNMTNTVESEFLALPRPLVVRYEKLPLRYAGAGDPPSKTGLLPPSAKVNVSEETAAFIRKHSLADLMNALSAHLNRPNSEFDGDACVVLTVALGNEALALSWTEYQSPKAKGKWNNLAGDSTLGGRAVQVVQEKWSQRTNKVRQGESTTNTIRAPQKQ